MALVTFVNDSAPYLNAENLNNNFNEINNKTIPEDISNLITFENDEQAYGQFKKIGNMVMITYQGSAKTHTANKTLFTLPSGYRPSGSSSVFVPFVKNNNAYGIIEINTSGVCKVNQISSTTASGRIYFVVTYVVN